MKLDYRFGTTDNTMLEYDKLRDISNAETQISVRADTQNSGTGRGGHLWYSPPGGLWFTFDLPGVSFEPSFSLFAGFCIHSLLQTLYGLPDLKVKWTNDIIFQDKKLAGILCKHQPASRQYIVGVGVNTNNMHDDRMDDLNATSLKAILGCDISNDWLQKLITHQLYSNARVLNNPVEYLSYCDTHLFGKGRRARVECPDGFVNGIIRGIDSSGHLMIEDDKLHSICFGSIVKIESGT